MEWILVQSVFIIFSIVSSTSHALAYGVCRVGQRVDGDRMVQVEGCCSNFYKKDGVCVECPIGHFSKGIKCERCLDGQYGKKCAEICTCSSTERCDNVVGCIPVHDNERSTPYMTIKEEDDIAYSFTLREIILFVVITSFGLLVVGGLVYMCWKRQTRILITQHQHNEMLADNSRNNRQIQLTEEKSESVYDIIDESAMSKTLEPSTIRTQNSYFDVTYSPKTQMDVKDNQGIICLTRVSSQSQPVQKTNVRWQRGSLVESVYSCQGALGSAYLDGYLRPRYFEHDNGINKMMEKQGTKDKMERKEYDGHIYDEPSYDGIGRPANYDRLFKDTSNA